MKNMNILHTGSGFFTTYGEYEGGYFVTDWMGADILNVPYDPNEDYSWYMAHKVRELTADEFADLLTAMKAELRRDPHGLTKGQVAALLAS